MCKRILAALFLFLILSGNVVLAQDGAFFSPKRFKLKTELVNSMSGEGQVQRGIKDFSVVFMKALDEFMSGDTASAELDLLRARDIWPEFYGTDFVLALLREKEGDPATAARYYKSYLNKLRDLNGGKYGISLPVIKSLMPSGIETCTKAEILVRKRLAVYGIKVERVCPMMIVPPFVYWGAMYLIAMIILAVTWVWLRTVIRKHYKITHAPEGFWICRDCETENPYPNKVCQNCGKRAKGK